MSESQAYELNRLRESNSALAKALEVAVATIERIPEERRPFHTDRTLAWAKTALKNNKR